MLDGIRIVEFEGLGPAPFAAMTLADLGADVIVIHRKGGPPSPGQPDRSLLDRGKRSIELDLKDPDDRETALCIVAGSDALIEGFRPGVMENLGLGPETCHARNPGLVYGRMTGWGQDGPLAAAAGHDLNYIGLSGALWYASAPGDLPLTPATLVGDIGGGAMYLVAGLVAGLLKARASGSGTVVDAAIYDGSAHMMNLLMSLRQSGNLSQKRGESLLDGPHWSRTYRCGDGGYISVQCLEPKFYRQFLARLNLAEDPDFARQFDRTLWPRLNERLGAIFGQQSRDYWADLFAGSDACVAPVLSPDEAMSHPANQHRHTWHEMDGILQAAPAPRFDGQKTSPKPAPQRGAHSDEIRAEFAAKL
ncbi:CaiB/BaiF CoA-transferase family protein [Ruegeria sp. 2205SS24-7]|uniref:CaiB/BaiF CoA transferase family protein n=1 Tax=Ruegeria discodermiae TaxID=3064389 RepID=UPI002741FBEE|nr:CaiB/BaiF CoA-transferase family protein [Ruegeria sp. 2205SS24-7]MDP5217535.1 CaiB/BaiF CoA-transferase family protein [Ruegeria sp. 2205SS24-7]